MVNTNFGRGDIEECEQLFCLEAVGTHAGGVDEYCFHNELLVIVGEYFFIPEHPVSMVFVFQIMQRVE